MLRAETYALMILSQSSHPWNHHMVQEEHGQDSRNETCGLLAPPPPPMRCSSSSLPLRSHLAVGMGSHFFHIWFVVGSPLLSATFSSTSLQVNCLCLINDHVISLLDSVDVWIILIAFSMLNSVKFLNKAVFSGVLFPFKNITEFGLHTSCLGYFNLCFEWDLFTFFTSFYMHLKLWIILYAN